MPDKKKEISMESGETEVTLKTEIGWEGELSCLIVYSEQKHVKYIYPLLSQIEKVLRDKGFKPIRLGDEIRSGEDYLNKLEKLIEDCILGVVIFDGFRANVLFEFGFLRGRKKPVILLQSKDAFISVNTLYKSFKDSELSEKSFKKLQNPTLDHSFHFSDFAGKHIAYIDWRAKEADSLHPCNVLEKELNKNKDAVIEEVKKVKTRNIPTLEHAVFQRFLQPLMDVIKYYTDALKFDIDDLKRADAEIKSLACHYGFQLPFELHSMIAATYTFKAKKLSWGEVAELTSCLKSAIDTYEQILESISIQDDPIVYSATQKKIGDIHWKLSQYRDKAKNCNNAIKAYKQALKVYTLDHFPMQYATTQNNLGSAYRTLAEVEAKAENCKKAIKAYEQALKVRTLDRFPMDYAMSQNNLGNAYGTLAEVEAKAENCKKAVKAYKEALKVYTLDHFPMQYATTQNNLGSAYRTLAEVEAKAENCKKAIKACKEALKVRTLDRFPMDYAMSQNNLGTAYGRLAEVEAKAKNCKKAVKACKEALKVYTLDCFPMDYATTQNNLGSAYGTLAEVEAKAENCKKAIKAYKEALKVFTMKEFPEIHPLVNENLKNLLDFCEGE